MDHYENASSLFEWKIEQIPRINVKNIMILLYFFHVLKNDTFQCSKIGIFFIYERRMLEKWTEEKGNCELEKAFAIDWLSLGNHVRKCFFVFWFSNKFYQFSCKSRRLLLNSWIIQKALKKAFQDKKSIQVFCFEKIELFICWMKILSRLASLMSFFPIKSSFTLADWD